MKYSKFPTAPLVPIFIIVLSFLLMNSAPGYAQTKSNRNTPFYGLEASAGLQSFQLTSDIATLSEVKIDQRGAGVGFVFGDAYWQARIKPIGLYNSGTSTQTTVKLIESGANLNFYPIKILTGKTSRIPTLYFTGGLTRGKLKVNGTFLPEGQTDTCIFDDETFSGSVVSWNVAGGAGIEYQITRGQEYITVFAEMKKEFLRALPPIRIYLRILP